MFNSRFLISMLVLFLLYNSFWAQECKEYEEHSKQFKIEKLHKKLRDWEKILKRFLQVLLLEKDSINTHETKYIKAQHYLHLGKIYEQKGRLKEAEYAYKKAFEIGSEFPLIKKNAVDSLTNVISKQKNIFVRASKWLISAIYTIICILPAALIILAIFLIGGSILPIFNKSIEISEFNDTSSKRFGSRFVDVLLSINNQLHSMKDYLLLSEKQSLPAITRSEDIEGLPNINARIGPLEISAINRQIKRFFWIPRYKIEGSVHVNYDRVLFFIHVFERRARLGKHALRLKKTWEKILYLENGYIPYEEEKKFAYEIIFLFFGGDKL